MQRRDLLADDPTVKLEIKGDKVPPFGFSVELFHFCIICIFLPSSSTLICLIFVHILSIIFAIIIKLLNNDHFQVAGLNVHPVDSISSCAHLLKVGIANRSLLYFSFVFCDHVLVHISVVSRFWALWRFFCVHISCEYCLKKLGFCSLFLSLYNLAAIEVDIVLANDTPPEMKN